MCDLVPFIAKTAKTFNVEIHMAGDASQASLVIQRLATKIGMCVTIAPQSFIYSGGREEGFRIGLINYPRFPAAPEEIIALARNIANELLDELGQDSYSIVSPNETEWLSRREK